MKQIMIFMIAFLLAELSMAQNKESFKYVDEFKQGKYQVKIMLLETNVYGYSIFLDGEQQVHQTSKPYFSIPVGFYNKENARIVAKWHVKKIQEKNNFGMLLNVNEAKEIGVTEVDLIFTIDQKN